MDMVIVLLIKIINQNGTPECAKTGGKLKQAKKAHTNTLRIKMHLQKRCLNFRIERSNPRSILNLRAER